MDYRPTTRHHWHDTPIMIMIMIMITHPGPPAARGHDLYMTFSHESYYPILRTLQCCGLLFKIVGEELVHYNLICLQIWNASELRGAYIQRFTEVVL